MSEADVLSLLREALATATLMATPLLLAALFTGLAIGLLQALTSIQEMTLTFVPKIGVIVFVFWITASMIAGLIINFFDTQVLALIEQ